MSTDSTDLMPADPSRGLTTEAIDAAEDAFDGHSYAYGMSTALGGARVTLLVETIEALLRAGVDRETVVLALLGGCLRLERDGHREYSDTVVRESIALDLEPAFENAGMTPVTDEEIGEVALLLSLRQLDSLGKGFVRGMSA